MITMMWRRVIRVLGGEVVYWVSWGLGWGWGYGQTSDYVIEMIQRDRNYTWTNGKAHDNHT